MIIIPSTLPPCITVADRLFLRGIYETSKVAKCISY